MILDKVNCVEDLRRLSVEELSLLAEDVRAFIVDSLSGRGGHLASSLGVVELTIALHYIFNTPNDRLIWDVGHQCYAHKILTGRKDSFHSIRQYGGLSGFPKISESPFDAYNVGHSSTSLSLAAGEAIGRDMNGEDYKVVAVIGDGSMTGGMAFEAMNQIGRLRNDIIIILNDNEHSISKNVGALSTYLTRLISGPAYNRFRKNTMEALRKIPFAGEPLFKAFYKLFSSIKGFLMPANNLFQDLGIRYFGPVDGHRIDQMCEVFSKVRDINSGPKIIHVITHKGHGYRPAEDDPCRFHGTGPYDRLTGKSVDSKCPDSYSTIAGRTLGELAAADKKIVAITAAMKLGTGLGEFERVAPDRLFDVGIAEQHAVTFACALAKTGLKPFVSIYSTFLQRAADQLIHDAGIMNLPVRILIDRAGLVGSDGETHHGLFDISIIKAIPNFMLLAPSNADELRDMIHFAAAHDSGPLAIRYPRGFDDKPRKTPYRPRRFVPGKMKIISAGNDLAVFSVGDMLAISREAASILKRNGINAAVIDVRSIKPLDEKTALAVIEETKAFITVENAYESGGFGEELLARLPRKLASKRLFSAAFPDEFITHGTNEQLFAECGLDGPSIAQRVIESLKPSRRKKTVK